MFGRNRPPVVEANTHTVPVVFRGPHPLAANMAAAVDANAALGLTGHSGVARLGMKGGRQGAFRGDLGPLQTFGRTGARVSGFGQDHVNARPPAPSTRGLPGNTKTPDPASASRLLALFARKA
jgi:hypothetical protein